MERTVPRTASEEVELYLRTYYSLLRSTADVQIRTLEEVHAGVKSLLHGGARDPDPDLSAFIYCLLRLPFHIHQVQLVVLGQSLDVFARGGYNDIESWQPVSAPARRRRCFFNAQDTLACFIASRSDIDDVIPILSAYQIEWNKLHQLFDRLPDQVDWSRLEVDLAGQQQLADALHVTWEDWGRLTQIWGDNFLLNLQMIARAPRNLRVKLLSGSYNEYRRATSSWWENVEENCPDLKHRPVYFVSSNTHSLVNLLTGFALLHQEELVRYIEQPHNQDLYFEWKDILDRHVPSSQENFLYYVLKKYQTSEAGQELVAAQRAHERSLGISRVPSEHSFDVEAQVIEIASLSAAYLDPRLQDMDLARLASSDALILNIDYPLGLAAYNILSKVAEHAGKLLGIYIMGKSATLNGVVGDLLITNVVHDEHSQNTYLFPNSFTSADVVPNLVYGTVLDNQKGVSVLGTFLQNAQYMDVFYREGYTDIEMEAGPYLSAVYEMYRPRRHPVNEVVNFYGLPYDLGIIHYASDTPLGKGKNLGAGSLSYFGMDSTYAASLAILGRIFKLERDRIS